MLLRYCLVVPLSLLLILKNSISYHYSADVFGYKWRHSRCHKKVAEYLWIKRQGVMQPCVFNNWNSAKCSYVFANVLNRWIYGFAKDDTFDRREEAEQRSTPRVQVHVSTALNAFAENGFCNVGESTLPVKHHGCRTWRPLFQHKNLFAICRYRTCRPCACLQIA